MATVYGAPKGFDPPKITDFLKPKFDMQAYDHAQDQYVRKLAEYARRHTPGNDLVGEVVRFGVADGYARYMVWKTKPLQLIHLGLGDSYSIPEAHARGLRLKDIKEMINTERTIRNLFPGNK